MATTKSNELQELINSLQNASYTPKTQEQLQQQAQNRYQSYYDQQRLSSQQEYERNAAALDRQLASLGTTYDKQREQSVKAYNKSYSEADRNMLAKGMQRSSYGAQVLGNIQVAGNEALQDIADTEAAHRNDIAQQQSDLASQLAQQLKQYDASQAADILAYMDELEVKEYERNQAAMQYNNQLAAQIYEYLMNEKQTEAEAERWQKEFDFAVRQYEENKKKSSGSNKDKDTPETPIVTDNGFLAALNGGTNTGSNTGADDYIYIDAITGADASSSSYNPKKNKPFTSVDAVAY